MADIFDNISDCQVTLPTISMATSKPVFIVLLGHSFIRRLRDHLKTTNYLNLGLNKADFSLLWQGFGGMHIKDLHSYIDMLVSVQPNALYIEIGSNDLCASPNIQSLVSQLFDFLEDLLRQCPVISSIIIGHVIKRDLSSPRQAKVHKNYNQLVTQFNEAITSQAKSSPHSLSLKIWKHKGLVQDSVPYLLQDGVHLNSRGHHLLMHSIKRALVTVCAPKL